MVGMYFSTLQKAMGHVSNVPMSSVMVFYILEEQIKGFSTFFGPFIRDKIRCDLHRTRLA